MGDFRFKFDWDPQKAATNLAKHGVAFAQAVSVFVDPFAATIADDEHSQDEQRWVTLGLSKAGRLMVVVHTYEEIDAGSAAVRIISARHATPFEMRDYQEKML